ncbi:hypothetical protein [Nannocystis pusilla]|uniref:hypothetical protein n=1 Tax=Nannocystis pusilla TaxID=889268 RepID=UPI003BEF5B4C
MRSIRKKFTAFFAGCALGTMALGGCDDAAESDRALEAAGEALSTPAELGLGDDWIALEPGLWTRADEDGGQAFLGIGDAGKLHAIASLEDVERDLRASAEASSEETQARLAELDGILSDLRTSEAPPPSDGVELRCSSSISASADAYPIACGVGAKALGSYSGCGYTGRVTTFAQVKCGYVTDTTMCGPKSGNPASCSSAKTTTGPASCYSYAYVEIKAPNANVFFWDENYTRGACPPPPPPYEPPCNAPPGVHCVPK